MNPLFWSGRRVLVTGHTGFKGSWLVALLDAVGAETTGFALAPADDASLFVRATLAERCRHIVGDVRDASHLAQVVADTGPEIVVHMAAQALVLPSYEDPVGTWATNVTGTVHLLEAVRASDSVRVVLVVTSDKCYRNLHDVPGGRAFAEDDPLGGDDPYSASKAAAEMVSASYRASFLGPAGVAVATVRAGNVIGGGDTSAYRLVPDLVAAHERGEKPILRRPGSIRPWQHVLDPLDGYLTLAEHLRHDPAAAGGWNFGPDDASCVRVDELAARLARAWGVEHDVKVVEAPDEAPLEAATLRLDSTKARTQLGWRARWSLDEALAEIVAFSAAPSAAAAVDAAIGAHLEGVPHRRP